MNFFEQTFYHNTIKDGSIALAAGLAVFAVLRILKTIVYRRAKALAKRTSTDVDDLAADLIGHIKFYFLFFVAVYAGSHILTLPPTVRVIINRLLVIALLIQGAIWGSSIFEYWLEKYKKQKKEDTASLTTFMALGFVVRIALWSFVLLVTLDNLGIDITALVTGFGVGGIAVALAVQSILGDLFASMRIVREIIEAQDLARFDRAHFKQFGDFSLNFESVYYVQSPDYNTYMDTQQAINLAIYRRLQEEGIEFAYSTQTVFLDKTSFLNSK
jgi:small-conductance mechanosensitive channel